MTAREAGSPPPRALRLFYDLPSTPGRARALLMLSDQLLFLAPLFLVTAIFRRQDAAVDAVALLLWGSLPRNLAQCFAWMDRPRDILKAFFLSAALVFFFTILMMAGWELVYSSHPQTAPLGLGTAGLALLAWSGGFLLFQHRAYRLQDFLCGSLMLMGLLENKPEAWLWVPLFFLALFFSSSLRHLCHEVLRGKDPAPPNLQNIRVLAGAGAAASTLVFFAAYFAMHGGADFPDGGAFKTRAERRRLSSGFIASDFPAFNSPAVTGAAGGAASEELHGFAEPDRREGRRGYRVLLEGLARKPQDQRLALVVRRLASDGRPASLVKAWPPRANALWRSVTCSTFDAALNAWEEELPLPSRPWPAGGIRLEGNTPAGPLLSLEYRVELPFGKSIAGLHHTAELSAEGIQTYRRGRADGVLDVFPEPGLERGARYRGRTGIEYASQFPADPARGPHPDGGRYLQRPAAEQLRFNMEKTAQEIFDAAGGSIQEKIEALRRFYAGRGFKYARTRLWRNTGQALKDFLITEKVGNCSYFATSAALLLRCAGVSTRLALGFSGGEWDGGNQEVQLRVSMAHAWLEVYFPGSGWLPVDPTAWVPSSTQQEPVENPLPPPLAGNLPPVPESAPSTASGLPTSAAPGGAEDAAQPQRERRSDSAGGASKLTAPAGKRTSRPETSEDDLSDWLQFNEEGGVEVAGENDAAAGRPAMESAGGAGGSLERARLQAGRLRPPGAEEDEKPPPKRAWGKLFRALSMASAAIVLGLLFLAFRRSRNRQAEEAGPEEEESEEQILPPGILDPETDPALHADRPRHAIILGYARLQKELQRTRTHRLPHQTPLEHARRHFRWEQIHRAGISLVRHLYAALYGAREVSQEEAEDSEKNCNSIRKFLG